MNDIETSELKNRFTSAILAEVDGDRSDLESELCEIVDVRLSPHTGKTYTILHLPGGSLPVPVRRAMGITYDY